MSSKQTPSQTVGPYFAYCLTAEQYGYPYHSAVTPTPVDEETPGERIRIVGQVLDGEGVPIGDAMIEIWQADGEGRYRHPADPRGANSAFKGFARMGTGTDPQSRFIFDTIRPGVPESGQAPHINVVVFMRGLLTHAYTRIYLEGEAANATDPVLQSVPEERRATLIAKRVPGAPSTTYRFDIRMQGDDETVFFDV